MSTGTNVSGRGLGAGLKPSEEWREDRRVFLELEALLWRWWQVSVDNWDAGAVAAASTEVMGMVCQPGSRQLAVRSAWARGGMPMSADKALEGVSEGVSRAKKLNGRAGWSGAAVERMA